ncbi:MAG: hypothetical protein ABSC37_11725 [Xanthobacteraceae bacterium]|jgi:hypothetical protein
MSKDRRIVYDDRCQIYALSKRVASQESIASVLGVSQSAASREMRRNRGQRGYRFKQAEAKVQRKGLCMARNVVADVDVLDLEQYKEYAGPANCKYWQFGGDAIVCGGPTEVLKCRRKSKWTCDHETRNHRDGQGLAVLDAYPALKPINTQPCKRDLSQF